MGLRSWAHPNVCPQLAQGQGTGGGANETLHLHATDPDAEWTVTLAPDGPKVERAHSKGQLVLRGAASARLRACGVVVVGAPSAAATADQYSVDVADSVDDRVSLPDGRSVAFATWGKRASHVVMFCHGGQMSRLVAPRWHVAETLGIQVVSADRPGIGRSDFYEQRSILDWAGDVEELMSYLKVERFSVVGVSAGTPYALACGLVLSERVDHVGVIAGIVPPELYEHDDLVTLVATDPDGARRVIDEHVQQVAADIPASIHALGDRPEPDGPLYRQPSVQAALTDSRREAYRGGTRGIAQDILLINAPWGFSLADLDVPCLWWHGEADPITPPRLVEELTASIASCTLQVIPGVGHGVSMTHVGPFLEALVGRT